MIRVATWNARAFFFHDPGIRNRKMAMLFRISDAAEIVCLQEAHGNGPKFDIYLARYKRTLHICYNFAFNAAIADFDERAGGLIAIAKMAAFVFPERVLHTAAHPARISKIC